MAWRVPPPTLLLTLFWRRAHDRRAHDTADLGYGHGGRSGRSGPQSDELWLLGDPGAAHGGGAWHRRRLGGWPAHRRGDRPRHERRAAPPRPTLAGARRARRLRRDGRRPL